MQSTIRKLAVLCMAGAALAAAAGAQAFQPPWPRDIEVEIVADDGDAFPLYSTSASSRSTTYRAYVEAKRGARYGVRVHNRSKRRVGLVIAVDGRNILSGDKSYLRPSERMYVLDPRDEATYSGWRTGRNRINRFYFTDVDDSYAEAWGDRTAMGVIAVAVFPEREPIVVHRHRERAGAMPAAPAESLGRSAEPGTGFGAEEYSPSSRVKFRPESRPRARIFLKYEWRETLCRKGIARCDHEHRRHNRFWDEPDTHYVPYPPDWREHRHRW